MVYCKLISKVGDIITYAIGALYNDLTGVMELNIKDQSYVLTKSPEVEDVYEHFIDKMLLKYQPLFDKGEIPEKMSYEI